MKISGLENSSFAQFFPWRKTPSAIIRSHEAEELACIRDSINSDFWINNYDIEGFIYNAPKTQLHPRMRSVKLFIRPAKQYFARIKKQRPDAKINEYERSSVPFFVGDASLEDKIREFLSKQQRYIKHCVHSKNHGTVYQHSRDDMFTVANTMPMF